MSEKKLPPGYKPGRYRPYFNSAPSPSIVGKAQLSKLDRFFIFILLDLAILVRLYKIPNPSEVVFDEVNFGGYVHDYFSGKFFIDVHPPLAKLIYYWVAVLFGYNGQFEFSSIGEKFDDNVPYVALRLTSGIFGVATIPLTYLSLRNSFCGAASAAFGSLLVLIENSLVTQSRFIFLDSPLIFALVLSYFAFTKFRNAAQFTYSWYAFQLLTGVGLGLVISMKSSGILTYLWFGVLAAKQLWTILGDLEVSDIKWWRHLIARVVSFIGVPLTIYCWVFAVHFQTLSYVGKGAGPMSPNFKSTLKDFDRIRDQPVEVMYGSSVTIKHNEMESYLHSHFYNYKGGSGEQQVTLYPFHTDFNNEWEIHPKNKKSDAQLKGSLKPVKDNDVVKLFHKATGKYLHVNDVRPPITEKDYANEVSCSGDREILGDVNYEFKIRIFDKKPHAKNDLPMIKLRATESVFQIFHQGTRCNVISHKGKLPKWGFSQNEVLCINEPTIPNTFWYIEFNSHPMLSEKGSYETVDFGHYSFFQKFIEYHKVMFKFNNDIGSDHQYSSRPESWPFLTRGVNYYSTEARVKTVGEDGSHVYYLGNVPIYYFTIVAVLFIGLKQVVRIFTILNPFALVNEPTNVSVFYERTFETIFGFIFHYLPYFYFERELFLHHYLPALYLAILTLTYFVEYQISKRKPVGYVLASVILALSGYFFIHFSPLIYGTTWTLRDCEHSRWFEGWDLDCLAY